MTYDPATALNLSPIVAEVTAAFERYEQALIDRDVEVLDDSFWDNPHTIRYTPRDTGYGFAAIHSHRLSAPVIPGGTKEHRIRLEILTVGEDFATVNLEYKLRGRDAIGRQSQTWVRFAGLGWKVVSAHVSVAGDR